MVKQTLGALLPGYMQCDLDVGEQFPNYYLHEEFGSIQGWTSKRFALQIPLTLIGRLNGDRVRGNGGNATRWAPETHLLEPAVAGSTQV